jgi:ribosomal protein L29
MAILRSKDIAKMNMKENEDKMKELKVELIKAKAAGKKTGKSDVREIKRTIAKLLTFKRMDEIKNKTGVKK